MNDEYMNDACEWSTHSYHTCHLGYPSVTHSNMTHSYRCVTNAYDTYAFVCVIVWKRVCMRVRVRACACMCVRVSKGHTRIGSFGSREANNYTLQTLQHSATPCNTLQHAAIYCNTLQHTATYACEGRMLLGSLGSREANCLRSVAFDCDTLQHTATHCNTLQHTATHCNTLQHTVTHCNTLQHDSTHCNTLQHIATWGFGDRVVEIRGGELFAFFGRPTRHFLSR